ncbi:hypothetical protein BDF20DRAFT_670514 [Mycotypha africana]|uniref:uncharacterized protein n=1 Tax=Mycotypha africana TaxID=64632 RepID=UPI0022FFFC74|nr:uncharacterized protein BDF20DRAFT_670514 [Mycotypha africana]KAI8973735.1 hypothetical protein BDF20DRAFT_670514 [Mycotypha africana]
MFQILNDLYDIVQDRRRQALEEFNLFWNRWVPPHRQVQLDAPVSGDVCQHGLERLRSQQRQQHPNKLGKLQKEQEQYYRESSEPLRLREREDKLHRYHTQKLLNPQARDCNIKVINAVQAMHDRADEEVRQRKRKERDEDSNNDRSFLHPSAATATTSTAEAPVKRQKTLPASFPLFVEQEPQHYPNASITPANLKSILKKPTQPLVRAKSAMHTATATKPTVTIPDEELMAQITKDDKRLEALNKRMDVAKRKSIELLEGYHGFHDNEDHEVAEKLSSWRTAQC